MRDKIYEDICRIHDELAAMLRADEMAETGFHESVDAQNEIHLSTNEIAKVLKHEPDFTKRIATPLPAKRRRRVTLLQVTAS